MPNIEIHGLPREEAEELRDKVFDLFKDKPYARDMVVTIYPTIIRDIFNTNQPFIRLVSTDQSYIQEILGWLPSLGLDIEHVRLEAFLPK